MDENQPSITRELGGYELEITLDQGLGPRAEHGGGLVIALGPDEFLGAGFGFRVRFRGLPPGRHWRGSLPRMKDAIKTAAGFRVGI